MMQLAIFDFDGTVTKKDSLIDFARFAVGWPKFLAGAFSLIPAIMRFKLGKITNAQAKEVFLCKFFGGMSEEEFNQKAFCYGEKQLRKILRPKALKKMHWHRSENHKVIVATAAPEHYLKKWAEEEGFDLFATRLETKSGWMTGRLSGKNCWGKEKIRRIKEKYALENFEKIYAYGDSRGDLELKEIAHEFFYKEF